MSDAPARMHVVNFTAESVVEAMNQLRGRERCLVLASVTTSWLMSYPDAHRQGAWNDLLHAIQMGAAHEVAQQASGVAAE